MSFRWSRDDHVIFARWKCVPFDVIRNFRRISRKAAPGKKIPTTRIGKKIDTKGCSALHFLAGRLQLPNQSRTDECVDTKVDGQTDKWTAKRYCRITLRDPTSNNTSCRSDPLAADVDSSGMRHGEVGTVGCRMGTSSQFNPNAMWKSFLPILW